MQARIILRITGYLWIGLSGLLLLFIPVTIWLDGFNASYINKIAIAGISILLCAATMILVGSQENTKHSSTKIAILVVFITWLSLVGIGMVPYIFLPIEMQTNFNVINAIFESASGFSTTGASIITDIEALPKGILLWRSITQWLGGMGVIVLFVSIMPTLGLAGRNLFRLEMPGDIKESLTPHIRHTTRRIWIIYLCFTCLLILLLYLCNMPIFEAVCHAFTTMSTGGFSPKNSSIVDYSITIQWIIIIFMFIAGINFSLHLVALSHLKEQKSASFFSAYRDTELKHYIFYLLLIGLFFVAILFLFHDYPIEKAFRSGLFTVISIATTTGFSNDNYEAFPLLLQSLILLGMFTGGCSGSTSGGIKFFRLVVGFRSISDEIKHSLQPGLISSIKVDGKPVSANITNRIFAFICLYAVSVLVVTILIFSFDKVDFLTAYSIALTCIGNIGPGLGSVGPSENFYHLKDFTKIVCSLAMLMGRLEFFTFIAIFHPMFWRK